jgi:hypothetical protein
LTFSTWSTYSATSWVVGSPGMCASASVQIVSPSTTTSRAVSLVASGVGSSAPGSLDSFGPPDPGSSAGSRSPGPTVVVVAELKL